jgi:hypothetical protein
LEEEEAGAVTSIRIVSLIISLFKGTAESRADTIEQSHRQLASGSGISLEARAEKGAEVTLSSSRTGSVGVLLSSVQVSTKRIYENGKTEEEYKLLFVLRPSH